MLAALSSTAALSFAGPGLAGVSSRAGGAAMVAKSKAIPFLDAPPALDGTMAGDKARCAHASPVLLERGRGL